MAQLKGIDVSHHNGSVDWAKVKADGVQFAFIKATQGTGYSKVDYFRNNAPVALGNGIQVGAYHYAVFSSVPEALAEAKYFYSVIKDYKLTYPVVLDLEENKRNASRKQLTDAAIAFMDFFKQKGYTPMLYTGKAFLESQLEESRIQYPLWIARYGRELGRKADIWQHTSEGRVNGINGLVDMNIAYRDFSHAVRQGGGIIGTVKVIVDNLNIRTGPGTNYPSIGKAKKGKLYNVTANVNDWHKIILGDHDNRSAWVFGNNGKYLSLIK